MSGTDKYTLADSFPENVYLANAAGAFGNTISQYVLGAILNLYHKFHIYRDNQRNFKWKDAGSEECLDNKRVLIIGAGDIGKSIAKKLSAFETHTVGIKRNTSQLPDYFNEIHNLDELDTQLPLADIVIGCIPNSEHSYHLFDEQRLMLMKNDAIFINVGRGSLFIQNDLIKVLKNGHLKGVALDVTEPEPLPVDSPLWHMENVIITPHISGNSFGHLEDTTNKIYKICNENIVNYSKGLPLINTIDFSAFKK